MSENVKCNMHTFDFEWIMSCTKKYQENSDLIKCIDCKRKFRIIAITEEMK